MTVDPMTTCNCGHPEKDHVTNGGPCRWSCNCRMFIDPDELQRLRAANAQQAEELAGMRRLVERAVDFADEGWSQVSEFLQSKWNYSGQRAALLAALSTPKDPT